MPHRRKDLNINGAKLWYLVGLITSDGCLSSDGRHIDITSKDMELLENLKNKLGFVNKIGIKNKNTKKQAYRIQIANKNFYEFLLSLGLSPNKSLSLGSLNVSRQFFIDFLRGLIDGDGCIRRWVHPTNFREQWSLRIYSGSRKFLVWLGQSVATLLKAKGKIYKYNKQGTCHAIKYGKMAARVIVNQCYYQDCLGLNRKVRLARACIDSYQGWERSETILNNWN